LRIAVFVEIKKGTPTLLEYALAAIYCGKKVSAS